MDNIHLIVDLDGFILKNELLVREMGFCTVDVNSGDASPPNSYVYDLSDIRFDDKDWKTALYVSNRVVRMHIQPRSLAEKRVVRHWTRAIYDLKELHETHKTSDKNVVGYKGGIYEKRLLDLLGIQSKNLEDWGCPKYDVIADNSDLEWNCGFHFEKRFGREIHCPRAEVHAFRRWLYREADNVQSLSELEFLKF